MRYTPTTINDLRRCLGDCPNEMKVEFEKGFPFSVKTVADLRALLVATGRLDLERSQRC